MDSTDSHDLVICMEDTAQHRVYFEEISNTYVLPIVDYILGGRMNYESEYKRVSVQGGRYASSDSSNRIGDNGDGQKRYVRTSTWLVTYNGLDACLSRKSLTQIRGPFTETKQVRRAMEGVNFRGSFGEMHAHGVEGIATALDLLSALDLKRQQYIQCVVSGMKRKDILVMPNSAFYPVTATEAKVFHNNSLETMLDFISADPTIHLSVISCRRLPQFIAMYERANRERLESVGPAQNLEDQSLADSRHLVLLDGINFAEVKSNLAKHPYLQLITPTAMDAAPVAPASDSSVFQHRPLNPNPSAISDENSTLKCLLTSHTLPQTVPSQQAPIHHDQVLPNFAQRHRIIVWQGELHWSEDERRLMCGGGPVAKNGEYNMHAVIRCSISVSVQNQQDPSAVATASEFASTPRIFLHLIAKTLIQHVGDHFIKNSRSVLLHPEPSQALDLVVQLMSSGFAGCIYYAGCPSDSPHHQLPNSEILAPTAADQSVNSRLLILLYSAEKQSFLGFIPNDQASFSERIVGLMRQRNIQHRSGQATR